VRTAKGRPGLKPPGPGRSAKGGPVPKAPKAPGPAGTEAEPPPLGCTPDRGKAPLRPKRAPGTWKGKVKIARGFDEADAEIAALMAEGPVEPPA